MAPSHPPFVLGRPAEKPYSENRVITKSLVSFNFHNTRATRIQAILPLRILSITTRTRANSVEVNFLLNSSNST